MNNKQYVKPTMLTVELKQKYHLLAGSVDPNGMNRNLQNEEVDNAW